MNHLIIGNGNLGLDLKESVQRRKDGYAFIERLEIPTLERTIEDGTDPDFVWVCVGAGGPNKDPASIYRQVASHIALPWQIMDLFKGSKTKVILFSSHYLHNDPAGDKSNYARTKHFMEHLT